MDPRSILCVGDAKSTIYQEKKHVPRCSRNIRKAQIEVWHIDLNDMFLPATD